MLNAYLILLKIVSKKQINNKAVSEVLNTVVKDQEVFKKSVPKATKDRLGIR